MAVAITSGSWKKILAIPFGKSTKNIPIREPHTAIAEAEKMIADLKKVTAYEKANGTTDAPVDWSAIDVAALEAEIAKLKAEKQEVKKETKKPTKKGK